MLPGGYKTLKTLKLQGKLAFYYFFVIMVGMDLLLQRKTPLLILYGGTLPAVEWPKNVNVQPLSPEVVAGAYDSQRRQVNAEQVLADLQLPGDANQDQPVILVTGTDLFIPGRQYVFGAAQRERQLAIVSTHRLEGSQERLFAVIRHELAHLLGGDHCSLSSCVMHPAATSAELDSRRSSLCQVCTEKTISTDARRLKPKKISWNRQQVIAIALIYIIAAFIYPVMHAYLVISDVIATPGPLDDFSCLSCHGSNRGHIVPPDRSCLSCHPMDFNRHLMEVGAREKVTKIEPHLFILVSSYSFFCIAFLLFIMRPFSLARMLLAVVTALVLGATIATLFGVIR